MRLHESFLGYADPGPVRVALVSEIEIAQAPNDDVNVLPSQVGRKLVHESTQTGEVHSSVLFACVTFALHPHERDRGEHPAPSCLLDFFEQPIVEITPHHPLFRQARLPAHLATAFRCNSTGGFPVFVPPADWLSTLRVLDNRDVFPAKRTGDGGPE